MSLFCNGRISFLELLSFLEKKMPKVFCTAPTSDASVSTVTHSEAPIYETTFRSNILIKPQ